LQQQFKEHNEKTGSNLDQSRIDSVVEKCENAVIDIHRPIIKSESAIEAKIRCKYKGEKLKKIPKLTSETYEYISETIKSDLRKTYQAKTTSYNINTYRGRVYVPDLGNRTIPFVISDNSRNRKLIRKLTNSLNIGATDRETEDSFIYINCSKNISSTGRVKSLVIFDVFTSAELAEIQQINERSQSN